MEFFTQAVNVLKILVMAVGAGLGAWGVINLMEGYGNDNPGANTRMRLRSVRRHTFSLKFQRFWISGPWKRWFSVQKSGVPCYFFEDFFLLWEQHLFWHYDNMIGKLRCMSCHISSLKFQRFWIPRTLETLIFRSKKKIWSCCFTFWYFDNKSRKSRIRPWHIFERVFNDFRTFIIRNYWKISISPVSDSDTLWNRNFLMSIIAIRGAECRFNNW